MNLQDICLESLAKNFEQVMLDKNLDFLRRRFSVELLSRLKKNNNLKEEYTDILLNKSIRTLDTKWLENYSWDKVSSKVAEIGHNIEELWIKEPSCSRTPTLEPWHNLIRYLPNLKTFSMDEYCYDALLENIAKFCANIEQIDIGWDNKLTGVKYLCQDENERPLCRNLKRLFIEDIEKEDLKYLVQKLPSLVEISGDYELSLVLYSLHILSPLDKVKPYKFIELHIVDIAPDIEENFFKICLSLCPNLKSLRCVLRSAKQLDYLSSYLVAKVERLWLLRSLNPGSVTEFNVNNFLVSKGESIKYLELMSCSVSASALSKSCPRLETLFLRGARICFEEDSTAEFHSLNDVRFILRREPEDIGVNKLLLSLSKQLKRIEFERSDLSSSELQASLFRCAEQNPIDSLCFDECAIEMEFLKNIIVRCPALTLLIAVRCFDELASEELLEFLKTRPKKIKVVTKY